MTRTPTLLLTCLVWLASCGGGGDSADTDADTDADAPADPAADTHAEVPADTATDTVADAPADPAADTHGEVPADTATDTVEPGEVLAFPGAEGFGARATGGRGGTVLKVTNLDSSGEGSLAWAAAQSGPRIVVFEVSGVIEGDVEISHGDITIAGQTAPCAGVTLQGMLTTPYGSNVGNIVIRHLRVRPPDPTGPCSQHDAIQFSTAHTVILDHVDASHGADEIIDFWGGAHDITVSHSAVTFPISDATCDHPKGLINHRACIDTGSCTVSDPLGGRISVHHNLFVHCNNRTPALSTGPADVVNNVVYDVREAFVHHNIVGAHSTSPTEIGEFNIVGNTYIAGNSASLAPFWFDPENDSGPIPTAYFVHDNAVRDPGVFEGTVDDPFSTPGFDTYSFYCCGIEAAQFDNAEMFDFTTDPSYVALTIQPAATAEGEVLDTVGAWPRDVVTRTAVADVRDGTGTYTNFRPADLMEGLTPCAPPPDADGDGMSDLWESDHGLDPDTPDDHTEMPSGYTAIEQYVNQLAADIVGG
jgi:pectate lyase